jgi:acyl carrier protein
LDTLDRKEIEQQIIDIIVKEGMVDRASMTPDATLESLSLQSMDVVMVLMALEEKFNVYIPVDSSLSDVKDLQGLIERLTDHVVKERTSSAA